MNLQNNVGLSSPNVMYFKGKNLKVKPVDIKEYKKTLDNYMQSKAKPEEKRAVLTKIAQELLNMLNEETREIHFWDAYKMHKNAVDEAWKQQKLNKYQTIYDGIIKHCTNDIDNAIMNNRPKAEVDKLFDTLEIFTTKYGNPSKLNFDNL